MLIISNKKLTKGNLPVLNQLKPIFICFSFNVISNQGCLFLIPRKSIWYLFNWRQTVARFAGKILVFSLKTFYIWFTFACLQGSIFAKITNQFSCARNHSYNIYSTKRAFENHLVPPDKAYQTHQDHKLIQIFLSCVDINSLTIRAKIFFLV